MPHDKQGEKISIFFLPSCPCCCPSAVSSSMDQRDVGHNTGAQSPTHTVSLLKMTQQRSECWTAPLQLHPACIRPPTQPRIHAALPACLEHVSNYLDLCLPAIFTAHSASLSLISCTTLAPCLHLSQHSASLPASTNHPVSPPCSLYPNHLISYSPSVRLRRSSFFVAITSLTLQPWL